MLASLLICVTPTVLAAEQSAVVVDRIVAVVGERLVLQSDISLESALTSLESESGLEPHLWAVEPLQAAIDRAILRGLAGNAAIYVPPESEVQNHVARLRAQFPTLERWVEFLRENGLDPDRISSLVYSRLVVARYVQRNLSRHEGMTPRASYEAWMTVHRARTPLRMVPIISTGESGP